MTIYFINGSQQSKKLMESDYIEDIIDVIIDFFETHGSFPHLLQEAREGLDVVIRMPNTREYFRITDVSAEDEDILLEWSGS